MRSAMERPMTLLKSEHRAYRPAYRRKPGAPLLSLAVAATAVAILSLAVLVPPPLVLPAVCGLAFTSAAIVALFAFVSRADPHAGGVTLWDVAGGFAVIWVAAGVMSDPDHIMRLFEHLTTTP
jgi:hypothetical protein